MPKDYRVCYMYCSYSKLYISILIGGIVHYCRAEVGVGQEVGQGVEQEEEVVVAKM